MKTRKFSILIAASMFAIAGSSAFANDKWQGDVGDNWLEHVTSTKTRAQVIAELSQARAQGFVIGGQEVDYPKTPVAKSTLTREAVIADLITSKKNSFNSVDYSSGQ